MTRHAMNLPTSLRFALILTMAVAGVSVGAEVAPEHASVAAQQPPVVPAEAARVVRDVPYLQRPGVPQEALSLDIYAPPGNLEEASSGPWPVVVYVHGGGWSRGDKAQVGDKPRFFNAQRVGFVSVNYRLSPEDEGAAPLRHPAHVEDVAAAIAWVHDHIAGYGGDPSRLLLMGHSAGAGIAATVAVDPRYLGAHRKPLTTLRCVVSNDTGSYDIPRQMAATTERSRVIYERAFGDDPAGWRDASPAHHVAPDQGVADFLIIHRGWRGRRQMAIDFAAALTAAGVKAQAHHANGLSHRDVNAHIGQPDKALHKLVWRFSRACLKR